MTDLGLLIQIDHLRVGGRSLIQDQSIRVAPGQVTTVMGASGVGKSSLLNLVAGLLAPPFDVQAKVTLAGRDLSQMPLEDRRLGLMFQSALLFPHLNVAQNIGFGMPRSGSRAARKAQIADLLGDAGLGGFEDRDPATLSGGQAARVALLRALAAKPEALLLDEPFAKLDYQTRQEIRAWTFATARAANIPTLMVTHDRGDAEAAAGPIIRLGDA